MAPNEEDLAWRDARREAIDRIAARYPGLSAQGMVAAVRTELESEMPRLVPVEVRRPGARARSRKAGR